MEWKTIWDYFSRKSAQYSSDTALTFKENNEWRSLSYSEYYHKVLSLAAGLNSIGLDPENKVALYAPNCPEWKYSYLACMANASTIVPIDNKMSLSEFGHIMNSSKARFLIITQNDVNDQFFETILKLKYLDIIVIIGKDRETIKGYGLEKAGDENKGKKKRPFFKFKQKQDYGRLHFTFVDDLYHQGKEDYTPPAEKYTNDIASIIYTSGTMGIPKGVMLTHENFLVNMKQIDEFLSEHLEISPSDRLLLVLPLNHAYAFTANFLLPLLRGMSVVFVESLTRVTQNADEQHPTMLIAVPLLLEKMYGRIQNQLQESKIKNALYRFPWFKKIVGKKFKDKLGGSLRFIISGGAPLDPQICKDFWDMGLPILQGYGMTEAAPVISVNPPSRPKYASVGIPLPGIEVKTIDHNDEGIGELLVKGKNVMQGYYGMPEETAKILKENWLHTGDLGYIDNDNYIFIKGRQKNIIVNREGKNIYPEEIEIVLNDSIFIEESLVVGYQEPGSQGEKVGAIIVPDLEYFEEWSAGKKISLTDEVVENIIKKEVKKHCGNIASYKHPRKIKIRTEPFQKTPTQKIKRSLYEF